MFEILIKIKFPFSVILLSHNIYDFIQNPEQNYVNEFLLELESSNTIFVHSYFHSVQMIVFRRGHNAQYTNVFQTRLHVNEPSSVHLSTWPLFERESEKSTRPSLLINRFFKVRVSNRITNIESSHEYRIRPLLKCGPCQHKEHKEFNLKILRRLQGESNISCLISVSVCLSSFQNTIQ